MNLILNTVDQRSQSRLIMDIYELAGILENMPGRPQDINNCDRCGSIAESPPECTLFTGNVYIRVFICGPCRKSQLTEPALFFDEGWEELRKRFGGRESFS